MTISRFNPVIALALLASPVMAQPVSVPSGIEVSLMEVMLEEEPHLARFRFLAPAIDVAGQGVTYDEVLDDLHFLCEGLVVPALSQMAWTGEQIVISLSAREIAFGTSAPDVTQFFQPFTKIDDTCMWEEF